ncbi:DUF348 domain-containing protein [Chloroflexi bacterium TSY]|nr:DUF348 domain-containing protein [Chloroflexi bacterium TSY]
MTETIQTHRRTIEHLLVDLDLSLQQHDRLTGLNDERLLRNSSLRIDRARPIRILSDGRDISLSSWGGTAWDVLRDAGVAVNPSDQVVIDGKRLNLREPLPARVRSYLPATFERGYAWESIVEEPLQIRVYRSIPITIDDGSLPYTIRTTAETQ